MPHHPQLCDGASRNIPPTALATVSNLKRFSAGSRKRAMPTVSTLCNKIGGNTKTLQFSSYKTISKAASPAATTAPSQKPRGNSVKPPQFPAHPQPAVDDARWLLDRNGISTPDSQSGKAVTQSVHFPRNFSTDFNYHTSPVEKPRSFNIKH